MVFMRYWSYWNFIALFPLSFIIYYAFIWVLNLFDFSYTYLTIVELHNTHLFYLCVFLCVIIAFITDLFVVGFMFNFAPTPTDYLRYVVRSGLDMGKHKARFNAIYDKIEKHYIQEDIQREGELDRKREEIARLVAASQQLERQRNP